ncbi:DUF2244 domain-containing protein [Paenibacillus sp. GSMTC-2017]|uniref:DUF2244 domain-containing protein n=1 Tax=Paenibacillus sp. GSMTC-2017 TaxID=2794350 RepID=UPI0018D6DE9C|nr:DUF2244 domain-containing protein [Paenibacillus sp. GSMTC-2017]MBH5319185.1 DUF2244 domain-containing protein [Paenibacillus sp. GSMTC-2017]
MSKSLSIFFASLSILFMSATAISISHNGWLVLLFSLLSLFSVGAGFIVKARLRRKNEKVTSEDTK